jgi:hypothetical protein
MTNYRFGKHPPKVDYRTLRFMDYVKPTLAAPPPAFDVLPTVYKKLNEPDPTKLFPMDANDQYGDCTIAALAHADTVFNGLVGKKKILAKPAVVKLYMHLTNGVDSGLNELDVLNYWQSNAVDGDEITAFASIKPKNHVHVQQAIQLLGGVYLGFQVQKDAEKDFDARKPWTPGPLTTDGHAVYAVAYDAAGVTVLTWGNTQLATWAWWDECVDEAYALVPPSGAVPAGLDIAQLKADLAQVAT